MTCGTSGDDLRRRHPDRQNKNGPANTNISSIAIRLSNGIPIPAYDLWVCISNRKRGAQTIYYIYITCDFHSFMFSKVKEYRRILAVLTSVPSLAPWSRQNYYVHVLCWRNATVLGRTRTFVPTELLFTFTPVYDSFFLEPSSLRQFLPSGERAPVFSTHPRGEKFKTRIGGIFRAMSEITSPMKPLTPILGDNL